MLLAVACLTLLIPVLGVAFGAMAVNSNDPGNTDPDSNNTPEQNPVRLTLGHYCCANCGEDCLSRGDPICPRCQHYLWWDRVDI